jgi:hypothetical protein
MAVEDETEAVGYRCWPRAATQVDGAGPSPIREKRRCCRRLAIAAEVIAR